MARVLIAALVCVAAVAARGDEPRVRVASCRKANLGVCFEYRNETAGALRFNKSACDARMGHVWSEVQACPAEKRIAHCKREMLGSVTQANFYPPATMQRAKEDCAALVMELEPG
jgi:hypothetical protein